jgi:hypothetical protein
MTEQETVNEANWTRWMKVAKEVERRDCDFYGSQWDDPIAQKDA